jgi:hypothetical protein
VRIKELRRGALRPLSEVGALVAAACAFGLLAVQVDAHPRLRIALAVGASTAWLGVLVLSLRGHAPRRAVAVLAVALALGPALARPPQASQDMWTYVMHGRIQAVHGASPYVETSSDVPQDPFVERVRPRWRETPSPYGPLFSVIEATGARVSGDSPLANRLVHQGLALAAAGAALLMVPSGRRRVALVLLGLSPATVMIVNGGHNDLLVGIGVAAAVWALDRRRTTLAVLGIGAAALVKLTVLVALPAALWWLWRRNRWRDAAWLAVGTTGLVSLGYLLAGGMTALRPVIDTGGQTTRASLWHVLYDSFEPDVDVETFATIGPLVALVVLAPVVLLRYGRRSSPGPGVLGMLVAGLATLPWLMPWYVGWVLPSAAARPGEEPALLATVLTGVLVVGYAIPPGGTGPDVVETVSSAALPAFVLIATVVLVTRRARAHAALT